MPQAIAIGAGIRNHPMILWKIFLFATVKLEQTFKKKDEKMLKHGSNAEKMMMHPGRES